MQVDIIDISNNQHVVDVAAIRTAGVIGFAHKAGEGASWHDVYFAPRMIAARAAGFKYRIPYWVIRQNSGTGAQQAAGCSAFLDSVLGGLQSGEFIQVDWEGWGLYGNEYATAAQALDFANALDVHYGRPCTILYYGLPNPYKDIPAVAARPMWLADYRPDAPTVSSLWPRAAIWQWTDKAPVAGLAIDANQIVKADIVAALADPPPAPAPTFPIPPLIPWKDDMAQVIALDDAHGGWSKGVWTTNLVERCWLRTPLAIKQALYETGQCTQIDWTHTDTNTPTELAAVKRVGDLGGYGVVLGASP